MDTGTLYWDTTRAPLDPMEAGRSQGVLTFPSLHGAPCRKTNLGSYVSEVENTSPKKVQKHTHPHKHNAINTVLKIPVPFQECTYLTKLWKLCLCCRVSFFEGGDLVVWLYLFLTFSAHEKHRNPSLLRLVEGVLVEGCTREESTKTPRSSSR